MRRTLKQDHDALRAQLSEVEAMGAKVCAPKEFASAEARLDFFLEEWNEREYREAKDELATARRDLLDAKRLSLNCIETTPPDTDRDGIADNLDRCPTQAEDVDGFQDADGCPDPDNDSDAIADAVDKCPNEPESVNGFEDADGCPDTSFKKIELTQQQILLKESVHFATGRSMIQIDSYPLLDEVAQALKDHPAIKIRIEGHTDSVGKPEKNQALSEARANSVMQYLASKGIDAARMTAEGFGPSRPIAPNSTDKGKAQNRRVEIHITSQ
jgi:outer membrane protein OmpA-like peptidoglycan-associated protein